VVGANLVFARSWNAKIRIADYFSPVKIAPDTKPGNDVVNMWGAGGRACIASLL
jgi:hypothetical protein